METRRLIGLGKALKRISNPQLKRAQVCTNGSSINHVLIKMCRFLRSEEAG